ncbi:hypothetical protein BJX76DRAFT_337130 [Aspergillus varians]
MPKDFDPKHPKRKAPYPDRKPRSNPQSQDRDRDEKPHTSINDLKRRIRDVKRLLNKPDLHADKRITQERALAGYEKELADEEKRRERSKMITKYHFVRFLDRKTAMKEISNLSRKRDELVKSTDGSTDEAARKKKLEKLDARVHTATVNLNYTIYYPLTEKYISIYAEKKKKGKEAEEDQDMEEEKKGEGEKGLSASATAEKQAMWKTVEKCMEDGTLDLLREGRLSGGKGEGAGAGAKTEEMSASGSKKAGGKEKVKGKASKTEDRKGKKSTSTKHRPPVPAEQEEQDESDGGFFEM